MSARPDLGVSTRTFLYGKHNPKDRPCNSAKMRMRPVITCIDQFSDETADWNPFHDIEGSQEGPSVVS